MGELEKLEGGGEGKGQEKEEEKGQGNEEEKEKGKEKEKEEEKGKEKEEEEEEGGRKKEKEKEENHIPIMDLSSSLPSGQYRYPSFLFFSLFLFSQICTRLWEKLALPFKDGKDHRPKPVGVAVIYEQQEQQQQQQQQQQPQKCYVWVGTHMGGLVVYESIFGKKLKEIVYFLFLYLSLSLFFSSSLFFLSFFQFLLISLSPVSL